MQLNISYRWVHAQFIAVDANFKLKLKNHQINDPELGSGWSYFVENSAYAHHVTKSQNDKEVGFILTILAVREPILMCSRSQVVAANSMPLIKPTRGEARTTSLVGWLRWSVHAIVLSYRMLLVICNVGNGTGPFPTYA